jgi:hypothetical protein
MRRDSKIHRGDTENAEKNKKEISANPAVVRKNPQDFSRIVYKMMLESRARARLSKNKAGMKRTG